MTVDSWGNRLAWSVIPRNISFQRVVELLARRRWSLTLFRNSRLLAMVKLVAIIFSMQSALGTQYNRLCSIFVNSHFQTYIVAHSKIMNNYGMVPSEVEPRLP